MSTGRKASSAQTRGGQEEGVLTPSGDRGSAFLFYTCFQGTDETLPQETGSPVYRLKCQSHPNSGLSQRRHSRVGPKSERPRSGHRHVMSEE